MSKEFKEKYERVCQIKDRAISLVETQLNGNIENVDAKELGEVADIAKDMAEIMELCAEAEYYHAITEAMEKNSDEENLIQMEKYLPESRYYPRPKMIYDGRDYGEKYYTTTPYMTVYNPNDDEVDRSYRDRMYYSSNNNNGGRNGNNGVSSGKSNYAMRDMREGRSGISRRTYMEMKEKDADKADKVKEMKTWASDFAEDVMEMLDNASPEEKTIMKQHLAQIASKIS